MKFNLLKLVILAVLVIGCESKSTKTTDKEQTALAQATAEKGQTESLYVDLKGNPIDLKDYKGKRILLNFWATWCKPCIHEMPALLKAQEILKKENYVFLLASDQSKEKIEKFIEQKQFDFNFIRFTGALANENIYALPTTFIFNEQGQKVEEIVGSVIWDSEEMISKLKNIK